MSELVKSVEENPCPQYAPREVTSLISLSGSERILLINGEPTIIRSRSSLWMDGGPIKLPLCQRTHDRVMEVSLGVPERFCEKGGEGCPLRTIIDGVAEEVPNRARLLTQD